MAAEAVIDADYAAFIRRARRLAGVDLAAYKPQQMRRRLAALAARHGATTLAGFAERMEQEPATLTAFKNFFTINVSEFLRDPPRWHELAEHVLPQLRREAGPRPLQIWSAGCSYGAEPYTLALLLVEAGATARDSILATDIDDTILARARRGAGYLEGDLRNLDAAQRARAFVRDVDGTFAVSDALKQRVRFVRQDLLSQTPGRGFDLIVCRNVVIYFTEDAKQALYRRMLDVMRPGGVLFVGGTEVVSGPRELGFEPIGTSFYRKRAASVAGAA